MAMNWILFVILFGVVVFVHELGHFLIAKLSGVFVERFALGFGPAILKKRFGETEYAICILPLGGYVKMRGEDTEEARAATDPDTRSFAQKPPRIRIAIAAMGPIANLVFPAFVFSVLFWVGMPTLVSRVGSLIPGSPAEQTGLKPGDLILAVEGRPIWRWADLEEALRSRAGVPVSLRLRREDAELAISVRPRAESDRNVFGEEVSVGKIGVSPLGFRPALGILGTETPAYKAGLRTGDVVTKVNDRPVLYWWQFEKAVLAAGESVKLEIDRFASTVPPEKPSRIPVELRGPVSDLKTLGLEDGELYVREVRPGSVAEAKGLRPGDRLFKVNGDPIANWSAFQQKVRENAGEQLDLTVLRDGRPTRITFVPQEVTDRNTVTQEREKRRQLGVVSAATPGDLDERAERYLNPFKALFHGFRMTTEMTVLTVQGLYRLLTGQLSVKKSLGGPISIFYLAGGSYETGGWFSFFRMMALLSITLAVINFLPIPMLDGGHLLFFVIEAVRGKPVSLRIREIAQQAGFVFIIALMVLTFYVDIERYFLDRIRAFFN